jgi:hypothetical protein
MSDEDNQRLHSAGAIVRHVSPFSRLDVPTRHGDPSRSLIDKWIRPFYMQVPPWDEPASFVEAVRQVAHELDEGVTAELLSYFNWRPRIVGAYFVAIKRFTTLEDQVGRLLLRSDVCYAGGGYCAALASLNSPTAIAFLEEYLEYYLTRPDLWFDQGSAMAALGYLDHQNGTIRRKRFHADWQRFVENKPNWDLVQSDKAFEAAMRALDAAAEAAAEPPRERRSGDPAPAHEERWPDS